MAPTSKDQDSYLSSKIGCSFSHEQARIIDKHIDSMMTGTISYHWTDANGGNKYYNKQ